MLKSLYTFLFNLEKERNEKDGEKFQFIYDNKNDSLSMLYKKLLIN